jgi:glycosyltransferase involved in cell wall biosynthesis
MTEFNPCDSENRNGVLLVIACLRQGGTEMQTLCTARCLIALGYRVTVLCLLEWLPQVREAFEATGATVDCLELHSPVRYLDSLLRIRKQICRLRPRTVHVQYIAPGLLSVLAARLAGVPRIFLTVHQEGTRCTRFEHLLFRIASRVADCTVFVSEGGRNSWMKPKNAHGWLPQMGSHRIIHNCVDALENSACSPGRFPDGTPLRIGYVGRIRAEKGLDLLLRALRILSDRGYQLRLVVAGDGPQLDECRELASQLGLAEFIDWLGMISPGDLHAVYSSFDILAVPSRAEGFGLVAVEAIAHGVPVVASRVGGLPEIVEHERSGLLFKSEDFQDLAHQLERVISSASQRANYAVRARVHAVEHFTPSAHRESLRQLYA